MNVFKRLGQWLLGISNKTLSFAKGLLITLSENPEVQALAKAAVVKVEEAALARVTGDRPTGTQKLKEAQDIVIDGLRDKGVPIVMNAVNIAIEAAVANLRKGD